MRTNDIHGFFPRDLFLGFDSLIDTLQSTQPPQTYPPYNVVKVSDTEYSIELALAGFQSQDIDITLEKGQLTISGQTPASSDRDYIHKGISGRTFKRTFNLAETIRVSGAGFVDGVLSVSLLNVIPEEDKPQKIEITQNKSEGVNQFLAESGDMLREKASGGVI